MKKTFAILLLFMVLASAAQQSPFNDLKVNADSSDNYSFVVSGHFYGGSSNRTGYPVNTLLANLDWVNDSNHEMLICLGDLFMDVKNDIPKYQAALFNKLELPLFNAVGNHDLTGNVYQDNFGETSYLFSLKGDVHLFLDTERNSGDIVDDQIELIRTILKLTETNEVNNVFIYSHRTVWKDAYENMQGLFEDNTQSMTETNFKEEVLPLLNKIGKNAKVYWFSGSLGDAPASFFYHEVENITIIATAIRGLPRDAMLEVEVNKGEVSFKTHSLTGQDLLPLQGYNVDYWQSEVGSAPFNWRLVPLYIKNIVLSRGFWYGVLATTIFGWITIRIRRKLRTELNLPLKNKSNN